MKIIRALFAVLLAAVFLPSPAHAENLITLSKPSSQLADGRYLNNDLATSMGSGGELDSLLSSRVRGARTWLIDPALLEEINDLADGYTYIDAEGKDVVVDELVVASEWLSLLRFISRNDRVVALTYGSPHIAYLQKYAPGELVLYNQLSKVRLEDILGREVSAPSTAANPGKPADVAKNSYTAQRKKVRVINSLVTTKDVETLRLGLAKTLNPGLSRENAVALTQSYVAEVKRFNQRLRVSTGNYTITASQYELPVTFINDFDQTVSVDLDITTTNSRVVVTQIPQITLEPRSQIQIKVPIDVIASGETALRLQLRTPKGSAVGEPARIPLRLAVISPVTTWFTTGMAIILLLAAIVQSVRRVKRRRNNE
jgi:hypothetical protein